MNRDDYYPMPKELLRAAGFVSKVTGEDVTLTPASKLIYAYMLNRSEFFVGKLGSSYYESQSTIAEACDLDYRTAGKLIAVFIQHNIIIGHNIKKSNEGHPRWTYTGVNTDLILWKWSKDRKEGTKTRELIVSGGKVPKKKPKEVSTGQAPYVEPKSEEPPIDDDFWMSYDPETEIDNWSL